MVEHALPILNLTVTDALHQVTEIELHWLHVFQTENTVRLPLEVCVPRARRPRNVDRADAPNCRSCETWSLPYPFNHVAYLLARRPRSRSVRHQGEASDRDAVDGLSVYPVTVEADELRRPLAELECWSTAKLLGETAVAGTVDIGLIEGHDSL